MDFSVQTMFFSPLFIKNEYSIYIEYIRCIDKEYIDYLSRCMRLQGIFKMRSQSKVVASHAPAVFVGDASRIRFDDNIVFCIFILGALTLRNVE